MRSRRVRVIANAARADVLRGLAALGPLPSDTAIEQTADLQQARRALYRAVTDGVERVLFAGGDGTLTMGLSLLAEACRTRPHPAIGVLPLGTGNAFAHWLGVPRGLAGARAVLASASGVSPAVRRFRPLEVAGLRAPFCGFGIDAQLISDQVASAAQLDRLGRAGRALGRRARYALSITTRSLPTLLLRGRDEVTVTNLGAPAIPVDRRGRELEPLAAGGVLWRGSCTMAAAATISCFGFGLQMFQYAGRRADRFHVRASDAGWLEIARNTRAAFAGHYTSDHVHDFLADRVELRVATPAPFEAGGEALGTVDKMAIGLGPELTVIGI